MVNVENCSFGEIETIKDNFKSCITTNSDSLISQDDISNDEKSAISEELSKNNRLCSLHKDIVYNNCVILTQDPWYTVDYKDFTCKIPENITFPKEFVEYDKKEQTIKRPPNFPETIKDKIYQERWYDWFSIPDYFHGNNYFMDQNNSNTCFQPCDIGKVPYPSNKSKCIKKEDLDYGLYANQMHYTPLQIVLLFGHTQNSVDAKHLRTTSNFYNQIWESEQYDIYDPNAFIDKKTGSEKKNESGVSLLESIYKQSFDDIVKRRDEIKKSITDLNIIVPNNQVIAVSDFIHTPENIKDAYDIATSNKDIKCTDENKILLKACDICFNGNSYYSNDLIMYRLNEKREDKLPVLRFDLQSQSQAQVQDVVKLCSDNTTSTTCELDENCEWSTDKCIYKDFGKFQERDYKEYKKEENSVDYGKYADMKTAVKIGVFAIIFMFIAIICLILSHIFWESFKGVYEAMVVSADIAITSFRNWIMGKKSNI